MSQNLPWVLRVNNTSSVFPSGRTNRRRTNCCLMEWRACSSRKEAHAAWGPHGRGRGTEARGVGLAGRGACQRRDEYGTKWQWRTWPDTAGNADRDICSLGLHGARPDLGRLLRSAYKGVWGHSEVSGLGIWRADSTTHRHRRGGGRLWMWPS